jgi:aerobic-type carbon monoxide dehydrogenase small subunit (CoxS/CutS family)
MMEAWTPTILSCRRHRGALILGLHGERLPGDDWPAADRRSPIAESRSLIADRRKPIAERPSMPHITLRVNGRTHTVDVEASTPLLYVLRNDLDCQGPRFGCGVGQCGACTVLIKGEAVRSCIRPVSAAQGAEITTLEGLAQNGTLHPVQQAWIEEQVPQCGFCQNGQILTATALLAKNPSPTDAEIRQGMQGTLCRCMTYFRVQAAIKRAARAMASPTARSGAEVER